MALLSKADLLKPAELETVDVPFPELGDGAVLRLRMMTGSERDQWETAIRRPDGSRETTHFRARLVAACAVGPDGDLSFTPEEVAALGRQRGYVLDRAFDAALALNRLRAQDVDGLEKNCATGQGDSTTASPSPSIAPSANCSAGATPPS
jgi:hypothetical protein